MHAGQCTARNLSVLDGHTGQVDQGDLIVVFTATYVARKQCTQFSQLAFTDQAGLECMRNLAVLAALINRVDDDAVCPCDEGGVELLFACSVGADSGDVSARLYPLAHQQRLR